MADDIALSAMVFMTMKASGLDEGMAEEKV